jgi:adenylate kinase
MNVVFLGPPGAGKGTQAKTISMERGMKHLSTGDVLREAVGAGTPVGLRAKKYMEKGLLVPDEVVVDIVAERIRENGRQKSFLLDGFPRNLNQAKALDETLDGINDKLDVVLYFDVSEDTAVSRLTGRWMCPGCGTNYHLDFIPPKKTGICDKCGQTLKQRSDDKVETVRERLKVDKRQTADLIDYYEKKGILRRINADRKVEKVHKEVAEILDLVATEKQYDRV